MNITFTLSKEAYLTSQELILNHSKQFKKSVRTMRNLLIGIFFILTAFLMQFIFNQGWTFLAIIGTLLAVALFSSLFFVKKIAKKRTIAAKFKQIQDQPELFTLERTFHISPQKINISIRGKSTKTIQWSIIQKVFIHPDFILYFLSDTQAGILACPEMKLTNEEREELISIISRALPKERILMTNN